MICEGGCKMRNGSSCGDIRLRMMSLIAAIQLKLGFFLGNASGAGCWSTRLVTQTWNSLGSCVG